MSKVEPNRPRWDNACEPSDNESDIEDPESEVVCEKCNKKLNIYHSYNTLVTTKIVNLSMAKDLMK